MALTRGTVTNGSKWTFYQDWNNVGTVGAMVNDTWAKKHHTSNPTAAVYDNTRTRASSNRSLKVTISDSDEDQNIIIRPAGNYYPAGTDEFWIGWWEWYNLDMVFDSTRGAAKLARIIYSAVSADNIILDRHDYVDTYMCGEMCSHFSFNYNNGNPNWGGLFGTTVTSGTPSPGYGRYSGGGFSYSSGSGALINNSLPASTFLNHLSNINPQAICATINTSYPTTHPNRIIKGKWVWREVYLKLSNTTSGILRNYYDGKMTEEFLGKTWNACTTTGGAREYFNNGSNTQGVMLSWWNQWDGAGGSGTIPVAARGKSAFLGAVVMTTDPAVPLGVDTFGNKVLGGDATIGGGANVITFPSPAVTNITTTSAVLNWNTPTLPSNTQAKWGTTIPLQNQSTLDAALVTTHAATMTPLTPGATYSYQAQSQGATGSLIVDTNGGQTFTTPTAPVPPPPPPGGVSLIIDEQFLGNTQAYYEGRGWYDGTNSVNQAMILENDPVLNKQVIYARWANPAQPSPNGGTVAAGVAWRFMRDRNNVSLGWSSGVSFWAAVKFINYIDVANSYLGHSMFGFFQDIPGAFSPINANGVIHVDAQRGNNASYWYLGAPSGGQQCNAASPGSTADPYVRNDHNYSVYWAYPERHIMDSCQNGWLHDNTWYEICGYIKPSVEVGQNANSGIIKLYYRPYGVQTWIPLVNAIGINMVTGNPGVMNQLYICAPYSHIAQYTSATQRMYLGWITLYDGDAIAAQTIQGFGPGGITPPPGPGPVVPVSPRTTYNQVL